MTTSTDDLLRERVAGELRKHLPVLPGWFSQAALDSGTLSKVLDVFTTQVVEWLAAIKLVKSGLFLDDAIGSALDAWGRDIDRPRKDGESDDVYRLRLKGEILRLRLTRSGVIGYITDLTGLPTTVILPWKDQDWRGARNTDLAWGAKDPVNGRSGKRRRTSTYYQGGVIDIVTQGHDETVTRLAAQVVAAGIQVYFTSIYESTVIASGVPDATGRPNTHVSFEAQPLGLVPRLTVRSGHVRRSGRSTLGGETHVGFEGTQGLEPILVDLGNLDPALSMWQQGFTWDDLAGLTWTQATTPGFDPTRTPGGEILTTGTFTISLLSGGSLHLQNSGRLVQNG